MKEMDFRPEPEYRCYEVHTGYAHVLFCCIKRITENFSSDSCFCDFTLPQNSVYKDNSSSVYFLVSILPDALGCTFTIWILQKSISRDSYGTDTSRNVETISRTVSGTMSGNLKLILNDERIRISVELAVFSVGVLYEHEFLWRRRFPVDVARVLHKGVVWRHFPEHRGRPADDSLLVPGAAVVEEGAGWPLYRRVTQTVEAEPPEGHLLLLVRSRSSRSGGDLWGAR